MRQQLQIFFNYPLNFVFPELFCKVLAQDLYHIWGKTNKTDMEKIQKDYGYLVMDEGHIYDIEGVYTGQGFAYKDMEAFESGEGICYVGEFGLEDIKEALADLEEAHNISEITSERLYRLERERIILAGGETRQTIVDQVREAFGDDYLMTNEQVLYFAEDVLLFADWACIATYLAESFDLEDCIDYDDKGIFNQLQHEAVKAGMTPKEYAEDELRREQTSEEYE